MCVCVCVCVSLSLSLRDSLSLSPCVFLLSVALSPCLSFVRTCAQQTMCSAAAQQQHQRCLTAMQCNAHFRSSNPTSQHLVSAGPLSLSLSLSLSFQALISGHPISGPRFRTSFYGPHYFSTSLQDSFSSGPRF